MAIGTALIALALTAPSAASEPTSILRSELELESAPGLMLRGAPIQAGLEINPPGAGKLASMKEWFPDIQALASAPQVVLRLGGYPSGRSPPGPEHQRASFVIDFDQPAVAVLREAVAQRYGAKPSIAELSRFVNEWIERKNARRPFDTAAKVAQSREGDCTEHAVLLAALARLHGRFARVILGAAFVQMGSQIFAFGHAWTEIHDGKRWQLADATHLPDVPIYLPMAALADEGPGYQIGLWGKFSPLDVKGVRLTQAQ